LKRLKDLRKEIEANSQEKTVKQIYGDVVEILKNIIGKKSIENLLKDFEKDYVKKSKFTNQHLRILKDVIKMKKEFKKNKSDSHKIDRVRKDADILIKDLTEFVQREEMDKMSRGKMILKTKEKKIEIVNADGKTFVFDRNSIKKVDGKVVSSSLEEFEKALTKQKNLSNIEINPKVFSVLEKEFGKFEVLF